ncbi:BTB/POZ domain-containing protein 6-B-like isoform X2 [Oratosquilla oratoria]|uniref:BTB/POZ domain-containing protein 6-B-like isoform X2 n=1 Tax=Oratosquilla oratoria TaxID=337810 RepID=UPI003F774A23
MVEAGILGGKAWQGLLENNNDRLQYLYTSGQYSDLKIVFPKEKISIKAHRLILSINSPVLGAMLTGPLAASKELTIPEDSLERFRKLLDHMYLGRMGLESVQEALEVYVLTHKYRMDSAKKACLQYICSNLGKETTLAALEISVIHGDKELNDKCKEMLSRDPNAVMSPGTVSHLSKETLRDLLKHDGLHFSSEAVPFKGLVAWGKAQLGQEKEEPSGSAVREKIGDLLLEVRFLNMSCDEFVDNVVDTNVLTHTECIHILRAIRGADLSTVPEDTPLSPARGDRCPKLWKREELFCCVMNLRPSYIENYTSSSEISLVENLFSHATIQVHYFNVRCGGTINIMDYESNKIVRSVTSEYGIFTFTRPAVLRKDKKYRVLYYPRDDVELHCGQTAGRVKAGNVTLSCSRGHDCAFYFCDPTSI